MPEQEQQSGVLKSQHSRVRSYVLFRNCTDRMLDVIWVGYSGELVRYVTMNPTDCKMINTFATHPWIFRDPDTGERMHVQGRDVYMPQPYNQGQRNRYLVLIKFPMRSLRSNTLWRIAGLIAHNDHVQQLELPRCLVQDIEDVRGCTAKAIEFRNSQREEEHDEGEGDGEEEP